MNWIRYFSLCNIERAKNGHGMRLHNLPYIIHFNPSTGWLSRGQLSLSHWPHHSRNELGAAVHEGSRSAHPRTSGEQQFLLGQHQYWPGWLRVVCRPQQILGGLPQALWKVSERIIILLWCVFGKSTLYALLMHLSLFPFHIFYAGTKSAFLLVSFKVNNVKQGLIIMPYRNPYFKLSFY